MIPFLLIASFAFFQVVAMGPIAIDDGQILDLADRSAITAERSFEQLAKQQVVLVGETHDDPGHHRVQLQVIQGLYGIKKELAIALEMFPRHLQPQLDAWVAGKLSEDEFLDGVEWFTTWGFDSELYMPIFRFARQKKIPLLAMNVKRAVVQQVRIQGMAGVDAKIKEQIPAIAPASEEYRLSLSAVFNSHPMMAKMGKFERFVEAQQVWDGVMAATISEWLQKNPNGLVVGLAGSGHISHGYGIPHQLKSQNISRVASVLPWNIGGDWVEPQAADYAWGVPQPAPAEPYVRFGIFLEDSPKEGQEWVVHITKVGEESLAAKAGVLADDYITHLNSQEIHSRHTLIRLTRSLAWNSTATLSVLRDGKKKDFQIELTR